MSDGSTGGLASKGDNGGGNISSGWLVTLLVSLSFGGIVGALF